MNSKHFFFTLNILFFREKVKDSCSSSRSSEACFIKRAALERDQDVPSHPGDYFLCVVSADFSSCCQSQQGSRILQNEANTAECYFPETKFVKGLCKNIYSTLLIKYTRIRSPDVMLYM
jgi:hypothetical protein